MKNKSKNTWIILISLIFWCVYSFFESITLFFWSLFGKKMRPLKKNPFLEMFNFFIYTWPKDFWKFPTGLKIGRSISTFIHFVFLRDKKDEKK